MQFKRIEARSTGFQKTNNGTVLYCTSGIFGLTVVIDERNNRTSSTEQV